MTRSGQEQIAVWVPSGTKERIRQLSREGEPLASVILRGLAALEGAPQGTATTTQGDESILARLERVEAHLALSGHQPRLKPRQPGTGYDREQARAYALQLQAEGLGPVAIAERLTGEGWKTAKGGPWRESTVRAILRDNGDRHKIETA